MATMTAVAAGATIAANKTTAVTTASITAGTTGTARTGTDCHLASTNIIQAREHVAVTARIARTGEIAIGEIGVTETDLLASCEILARSLNQDAGDTPPEISAKVRPIARQQVSRFRRDRREEYREILFR